jgi:hypothetical protein
MHHVRSLCSTLKRSEEADAASERNVVNGHFEFTEVSRHRTFISPRGNDRNFDGVRAKGCNAVHQHHLGPASPQFA